MKPKISVPLTAAILLLIGLFAGAPLFAQVTGTSNPAPASYDYQPVPLPDTSHYVPLAPDTPGASESVAKPAPPTPTLYQRVPQYVQTPNQTAAAQPAAGAVADPDGEVVTYVPVGPNELPIGARLKATLQQPISTRTTQPGSRFTAQLTADVTHNGVVLLPAGSIVYGRISHIHGGPRISGSAGIRLQPDSVSLPDGTVYGIHAEVTDLDRYAASHVNNEGLIVGNTHPDRTASVLGLTTTSAVVVGAVIGGGVGAVVGLGVSAGAATIWWLRHDSEQTLPSGTPIVFTLDTPLQLKPSTL